MSNNYKIIWNEDAKTDLIFWRKNDQNIIRRIELLLRDIITTPESGIGKPEKLKYQYSGYWSRRINFEHRLIYKVVHEIKVVYIVGCKGHYNN